MFNFLRHIKNHFHRKQAALHWNQHESKIKRVDWWESAGILRHYNQRICGQPLEGVADGAQQALLDAFPGHIFERAVSVGCGTASKEMQLLERKMVSRFDLFEISSKRITAGQADAERRNLSAQLNFYERDAFKAKVKDNTYDLVYWDNSLHHMFDVEDAIKWSRRVLKPGGVLLMNDFVGPSRFQWTDEMLEAGRKVREMLPKEKLRNPFVPETFFPVTPEKYTVEAMIETDPSEAADSERIIENIRKFFPEAKIIPTGGVIYSLALGGVIHNLDEEKDADLIRKCLQIDDECIDNGMTHYAFAIAQKMGS